MSVGGKLADISIPDDLILGYSESLQNFIEPIVFESNVEITGTLSIFETLNGHNHAQICEILDPKPEGRQKLTIKGDNKNNISFHRTKTIFIGENPEKSDFRNERIVLLTKSVFQVMLFLPQSRRLSI